MQLNRLALIAILTIGVYAQKNFQITAYENVGLCKVVSDTRFKVYGGNESSCHNLRGERPEEHLTCEQYNKGGAEGPLGCDDDWMKAHSARLPDWTQLRCLTWPETNCAGDNNQGSDDNCVKAPGSLGIKSFQCATSEDAE